MHKRVTKLEEEGGWEENRAYYCSYYRAVTANTKVSNPPTSIAHPVEKAKIRQWVRVRLEVQGEGEGECMSILKLF